MGFVVIIAAAAQAASWTADLAEMGWIYAAESDDTVMYTRPAPSPGRNPRIWMRYENRDAVPSSGQSVRSSITLYEVDCTELRYRPLDQLTYAKNNMSGDSLQRPTAGVTWSYAGPGTFAELGVTTACKLKS